MPGTNICSIEKLIISIIYFKYMWADICVGIKFERDPKS